MKEITKLWRIIFPMIIAGIIWYFSAMSGDASNSQSLAIAGFLGLPHWLTRKIAHVVLYTSFGYSLASFFKGIVPEKFPYMNAIFYSLFISVAYAAVDEIHQLIVAGRSGSVADVVLDSIASLCGILIYIAVFCFWRNYRAEKQQKAKTK